MASDEDLRDILGAQERISRLWGSDGHPRLMRLFTGEQRAIGELFIRGAGEAPTCVGYLAFLEEHAATGQPPLISGLGDDIVALATNSAPAAERLSKIQNALIDLLAIHILCAFQRSSGRRCKFTCPYTHDLEAILWATGAAPGSIRPVPGAGEIAE